MKTFEEYAIGLVADGAESAIEDDLNEDGEIADVDHEAALHFAMTIVRAIRANADAFLGLARLANTDGVSNLRITGWVTTSTPTA